MSGPPHAVTPTQHDGICGLHHSDMGGYVAVGITFSFLVSFAIGANGLANAFGTVVGSRTLSLHTACLLACIFELAGVATSSNAAGSVMDEKVLHIEDVHPEEVMVGFVASLISASLWVLVPTFFSIPISTSNTLVASIIGFLLLGDPGGGCVRWMKVVVRLVMAVSAPLVAAVLAAVVFALLRRFVLTNQKPFHKAVSTMPVVVVLMLIICIGLTSLKLEPALSSWLEHHHVRITVQVAVIAASVLVLSLIGVLVLLPWLRDRVDHANPTDFPWAVEAAQPADNSKNFPWMRGGVPWEANEATPLQLHPPPPERVLEPCRSDIESGPPTARPGEGVTPVLSPFTSPRSRPRSSWGIPAKDLFSALRESVKSRHRNAVKYDPKAEGMYSYLQVIVACFFAFAHGASVSANATGAAYVLWSMHMEGDLSAPVPMWLLVLTSAGMVAGIYTWGWRIVETIGVELVCITPSRGYSIQLGAAAIVMLAAGLSFPISTTYCLVGAAVGVGLTEGRLDAINWTLAGKIGAVSVVALVGSSLTSAAVYHVIKAIEC
eukprot:Sspe_Gene.95484::Locus_67758_Transcript_1_1_Confidence_1.000_Length_1841::g.95484::m.95484/K14640/SLC20A, PIT; solute carrier family 20 (sodium-dependent phosphate transporter)